MEATNGAIEHDFHNTLVPINGSHSGSSGRSTPNGGDPAPGKLFVGGLSWQTSSEKLREYFGMFGTVTDVLIMKDPMTQVGLSEHNSRLARPINYGYLLYEAVLTPFNSPIFKLISQSRLYVTSDFHRSRSDNISKPRLIERLRARALFKLKLVREVFLISFSNLTFLSLFSTHLPFK